VDHDLDQLSVTIVRADVGPDIRLRGVLVHLSLQRCLGAGLVDLRSGASGLEDRCAQSGQRDPCGNDGDDRRGVHVIERDSCP
jgi:hypothetical protein